MFNMGATELILILVIALVVFGPGKFPEIGKALGRGIHEFRSATDGDKLSDKSNEIKAEEKSQ